MGQPIVVTEKPSSYRGVVRFETNRALTGMGHERYQPGTEIWGDRPPDELARRLLRKPSVAGVQINSNVVTVDLAKGHDSAGLRQIIENLYRFYPDEPDGWTSPDAKAAASSEPAGEATVGVDGTSAESDAAASPEAFAEPADATNETLADAPDPDLDEDRPTAANPASADAPDAVGPPPASPVPTSSSPASPEAEPAPASAPAAEDQS